MTDFRCDQGLGQFDMWMIQESPPPVPKDDKNVPEAPVKQNDPISRPSSAGHTPGIKLKPAIRTRPTSMPGGLPSMHSVTFEGNPVSDVRVFESPARSEENEDSSPFQPVVYYMSPEDEREELPTIEELQESWTRQPPSPTRSETSCEGAKVRKDPESSSSSCHHRRARAVIFEAPDFVPANKTHDPSRRKSMPVPVQSSPSTPSRPVQATRISRAPPPTSPFKHITKPILRQSMDASARTHETKVSQPPPNTMLSPTPTPSKKRGLFKRAQTVTRSKIFGASGTNSSTRNISYDFAPAASTHSESSDSNLHDKFRLVEGCITFDREIKSLFEENGGLRRVWRSEAIPLFRKGDKEGFDLTVKRLQTAMSALAGKSVLFG